MLALHCSAHNRLIESEKLRVTGYAPCEEYWLADGTFLGFGYNPTVQAGKVPHVGQQTDRDNPTGEGAPET
ncbi:MAG: hypothetical protein ABFS86_15575 [Planctomycetota bacterium]